MVFRMTLVLAALAPWAGQVAAEQWTGKASYYALRSRTASGAPVAVMTAAHRTLPFGSKIRVTNLSNQRTVVVTVQDRGPFVRGRVVDVSKDAAEALGFVDRGVAPVRVEFFAR